MWVAMVPPPCSEFLSWQHRQLDAGFIEGSGCAGPWRSSACRPAQTPLPTLFTGDLSVELWEKILHLACIEVPHWEVIT